MARPSPRLPRGKHALVLSFGLLLAMLLGLLGIGCGGDDGTPVPNLPGADAGRDTGADGQDPTPALFNVTSAEAVQTTRLTVTFDAPPNPAQATVLSNYSIDGLVLDGTPTLVGNVVTLTTSVQTARSYTIVVSNVTRAADGRSLAKGEATFEGRPAFGISVEAPNAVTAVVRFTSPPKEAEALDLANYSIPGLTLSGTPSLANDTVTLTTSRQSAQPYTLTVKNVTRASDGEPLNVEAATFDGALTFNVVSATAPGSKTLTVTFDAPPNAAEATTLANYTVPNLTLSGTPTLDDNVVTLTTAAQADTDYEVTVANVTRADDALALTSTKASFRGRTEFNVASAEAVSARSVRVTFDAPPNATQAADPAHYAIPGLTVSSAQLTGSAVTLTTTAQLAQAYIVTVTGITRAADAEPLTLDKRDFTGRLPFHVTSASAESSVLVSVHFDAPPNAAQATTLANYSIPGLTLSGTPTLAGDVVRIATSVQLAQDYTVTVSGVTRASDGEALGTGAATFQGRAVQAPTVTNVVVSATAPNNGTTPFNTGTTTVILTGTDFTTVDCAGAVKGVKLDDLDSADVLVGTTATACTVDSDTQITATFPAGIRTNGTQGWNVIATSSAGSNTTSTVRFVPVAGLVISEVLIGESGAANSEFVEIYNATSLPIDTTANGIGLRLHLRAANGGNTNKQLTAVTTGIIPAKGHLLIVSTASTASTWYDKRDYTFSADLTNNAGLYISLSTTPQTRVLDKVGFGTQPAGGYEGTAATTVNGQSVQRKRAGGYTGGVGSGAPIDTDSNVDDFEAASTDITPRGTADAPEP